MLRSLRTAKAWMFLWVVGTVSGWILNLVIAFILNRLLPVYDVRQFPYLPFLPFLTTGMCLGLLQWRVALKGIVNGVAWISATTLAGFLVALSIEFVQSQRIIAVLLPGCLSVSCDTFTLYTIQILSVVILSVAYGLAAALPTGLVLSRYGSRIYLWVLGCILASLLGILTYIFFLKVPDLCPMLLSFAVIDPMVIAAVSAPFLRLALEVPPGPQAVTSRYSLDSRVLSSGIRFFYATFHEWLRPQSIDSPLAKGRSMSTPALAIRTVLVGLVLGIVATVLTFQHQIGLGFTLFGLALLGGLLVFARLQQVQPIRRNLVMLIPVLFFTLMLTVRCDPFLVLVNSGAAIIALLLLVYFFRNENLVKLDLLEYPQKVVRSGIAICLQPVHELKQSARWLAVRREGWPSPGPVLRGGAMTVPVVAVFVVLLSAADEVFARLVGDMLHVFTFNNLGSLTQQSLYTGIFAWGTVGCLAIALAERKIKRAPRRPPEDTETDEEIDALPATAPRFSVGFTESVMLLGSICAVFSAFVMIQFVYLFGGERNIANYSYADYVHRGFTELVIVAVLTLGLELTLNVVTIRRRAAQVNVVRGLSTALIVLTAVILLSAFQRLRLYELTYGFTSLRLLIYVFIGWLGFAFAGFILSLYWARPSVNVFGITALIAFFGFAATLDLLNPDHFVAMQNINRGDVDPLHFSLLSEEAAPALVTLVDAPEPGLRRIVRHTLVTYRDRLWGSDVNWQDFNLGRRNAIAVLRSVQDRLNWTESMPIWEHKIEDFASLRRGMTVREIARRFGFPYAGSGPDVYGEFSQRDNSLLLTYGTDAGRIVELRFDSSLGLIAMCVRPMRGGNCSALPFAP